MNAVAVVEHQLTGRLRLRIATRRGDISFFERIVQALSKHPDVNELAANPLTGGILVLHSGPARAITDLAVEQGLFKIAGNPPKKPRPAATPVGAPLGLDAIATGLSGLALFQVSQGQALGNATENFWNAYGAHRILGRSGIAAGFALAGAYQMLRGEWFGSASSLFFYSLIARQLASFDRTVGMLTRPVSASNQPAAQRAATT
jgi:hypothetical protein